jgi:hypothetical protein
MKTFKEFLLNEKTDKEIYLEIDKRYKELKKKDIEDLKALGNRLSKVNSAKTKAEFISLILDAEFGSKQWAAHDRYEDSINEAKRVWSFFKEDRMASYEKTESITFEIEKLKSNLFILNRNSVSSKTGKVSERTLEYKVNAEYLASAMEYWKLPKISVADLESL